MGGARSRQVAATLDSFLSGFKRADQAAPSMRPWPRRNVVSFPSVHDPLWLLEKRKAQGLVTVEMF
jgi:hypothetical protein